MHQKISKKEKGIAAVLTCLVTMSCLWTSFYFVPTFIRFFELFGAEIQSDTEYVLNTYMYWNVFGVIAILGFMLIIKSKRFLGWFLIVIATLSMYVVVATAYPALLTPILELDTSSEGSEEKILVPLTDHSNGTR